jgi:signal transduction histidine kinase
VRAQLVGAGLIGTLLLLGMMLAGARAMFISGHDLALLLTMLTFAAALSVGFGLLYVMPLSSRIERVRTGTQRIAGGELGSEVKVEGQDEIAELAADFNRMARALEEAAEREVEKSRRDLVAAVSHDLRTTLASTRALIEALADGVAESPRSRTLPLLREPAATTPQPPPRGPLRARQDRRRGTRAHPRRGLAARHDLRHHLQLRAPGRKE